MKKKFLAKLLIGFSTVTLFTYSIIYACADDGDWGWIFDSNFTPETFVDKSYSPLFLSQDFFYKGSDMQHNSRFNDEIVSDWQDYLKTSLNKENTKFFLLDSSAVDVKKLNAFYTTKKANPFSKKWEKKINLKDPKVKNFIEFLGLAQKVECVSIVPDYWEYEPKVPVNTFNSKIIITLENKYKTTTDEFLKNRYWFQTIKANFYGNKKQNAKLFFQKTESTIPKNSLYYRALAYVAGVEYQNKNYAKANYLYSQVFDKLPTMRVVAAYCFRPQEEKDWNAALTMAKNNDEKAALWAIQGYYGDEEKAISKIYDLNPKSEHLEYLLTRLVNRQEVKIDKSFENKTVQQNKKSIQDSINHSAIDLVARISQSDKTAKPYLWNIATGYLQTLNGNFAQADKNFDQAEDKMPKTPLAINQVRLLRLVNNLSKIDIINSENEKTITKDLAWLYQELPKQQIENLRYENATAWSKNYLSALYKSQNNPVMCELFNRNRDFYDNENSLQAMKSFLSKKDKTYLEEIASKVYDVNLKEINEYLSVVATFQNKIPEAIAFMQQSDTLQNIQLLGNPFNGNIKDCHDCEHITFQKRKYSQIEFLTILKEMQDKVARNEDVYTNSLLLGNAFYNITHFGNARLFYETNIIGSASVPEFFKDKTRKMITNCSLAKTYYQKAYEVARNDEEKAKCQYMLAKCERNDFYNSKYDPSKESWDQDEWKFGDNAVHFLAWNGFKNLKNNYSNTKYYQEVIAECGYFKTYSHQK